MERWCGKTAIVTGASSGIGAAIAEALVKCGMKVVGLARRAERIEAHAEELKGCAGELHAVKCDMRSEKDICDAFAWTARHVGVVHVLVNNAGMIKPTNLSTGDAEIWRATLETNVLGLCVAQREACKQMAANDVAGHIVNINSVAGQCHTFFPTINVYGATKHAVTNICEVLRHELTASKSRVKVTNVSPGAVKTEILSAENLAPDVWEAWKDIPMMASEDVADAVLYTLGTPPNVMVNEITMRPVWSLH